MSLLLLILAIISLVPSNGLRKSKKWFKGRQSQFALPLGVCLEKERIHNGEGEPTRTSYRLVCEEEDGEDGDRKVVAYHYMDPNCGGSIAYSDEYTTGSAIYSHIRMIT